MAVGEMIACLIENLPLVAMVTDQNARIELVNSKFVEATGFSADEVVGRTPRVLHSGQHDDSFYKEMWSKLRRDGSWKGEIWNRCKDGAVYPQVLSICALREGDKVLHYAATYTDITELRSADNRLVYLAHHDPLTHVPNRVLFADRLRRAIARGRRASNKFGLLMVDLDSFKKVNDDLGHVNGDRVLRMAAHLLVGALREADTVSRYGGDEFMIIVEGAESADNIAAIADRLVKAFARPVHLSAQQAVSISVSIGVAVYPDDGSDASTLIRQADAAMYRAKAAGKDTFSF